MDVHSPEFRTAVQRRIHLAGVEQAFRIEGALDPLLLLQVVLGEHLAHQIAFLHPDAVLAGQHAADPHAGAQNVGAECLDLLQIAGSGGGVVGSAVQIAVAGMKDVAAAQPVRRQLLNAGQHIA